MANESKRDTDVQAASCDFSEPPTLSASAPSDFPNVTIKSTPEDFIVEEMPLYEPSGSGTHQYYWIEKRGISTTEAVRRLASLIGKRASEAGVAGLKDARAVSSQWISFEHVEKDPAQIESASTQELRIVKVCAHGNKLKMGHLRGNRFIIRLRPSENIHGSTLEAQARDVLLRLLKSGVPNYFGPQRFGDGGGNAALGKMLVLGDRSAFESAFAEQNGRQRRADRKIRNFLVNAFQAELFNRVLARRINELGNLQAGDLAWLHRNGAVFRIRDEEEARREQARADMFEISPSGPLFGPKMILAEEAPGAIESEVLNEAGVKLEDFGRPEAERQPGARRPLRIFFLEEPAVEADAEGIVVRFALPPGSYATVVLREIC